MNKTNYDAYLRDLIEYLTRSDELGIESTIQGFQLYLEEEKKTRRSLSFCRDMCLMAEQRNRIIRQGSKIQLEANEKKLIELRNFNKARLDRQKKTRSDPRWLKRNIRFMPRKLTDKEKQLLNPL